jgi:hypothetical protein
MKRQFLVVVAFAAIAVSAWALWVNACDRNGQKASSAQASGCPYSHGASAITADASGGCPHAADAATAAASGECVHGKTSATAAASGECAHGKNTGTAAATAAAGCCTGASKTAAHEACMGKGAKSASASGECSMHGKTAAAGDCQMHGTMAAFSGCGMAGMAFVALSVPAGGVECGSACGGHAGVKNSAMQAMDCDACAGRSAFEKELRSDGVQTQIVPLGNGVMFVYTTDTPARVRSVQEAIARRIERLDAMATGGDKVKLCPPCREVRGAIASGKLNRQTVKVEGGCLTLITSNDASMVSKLRAMAGAQNANHKS